MPPPCEKKIIDLECNEGESLDTAYGPTGFSAFMRPRANMYGVCRTICLRMHRLDDTHTNDMIS